MKTDRLPKHWYIQNPDQEVCDFLVDKYYAGETQHNEYKEIKEKWISRWNFIGWVAAIAHRGCYGHGSRVEYITEQYPEAIKLTMEEFRQMTRNKVIESYPIY